MPLECPMNMQKTLFIILAIVLLSLGGCSLVSIGYNHADLYLRYKVSDYVSFNTLQKEEIRREIDIYMQWHRKNAVPDYIVLLQNMNAMIQRDKPLKVEEVTRIKEDIGNLYRKTMVPLIRPTAHVLSTLNSRQIEELRKTLADKIRKQKDEVLYGSEQKNLVMRAERYTDMVERLVGNLSSEQEERIVAISLRIPFATKLFLEQREAYQAELITLLRSNAGEKKIAALLSQWINTPEAIRTPQQQQVIQAYENGMIELTVRIYELLTARQKDHLRNKIASYVENFQGVSAKTSTAEPNQASRRQLRQPHSGAHARPMARASCSSSRTLESRASPCPVKT